MNSPEELAQTIQDFLAEAQSAVVTEEGAVVFDFITARYSLTTDHGKCVLHLWSRERNTVRRVVAAERKGDSLRLKVLRFGQSKPAKMEICRGRDRRLPAERRAVRAAYQQRLRTVLERHFGPRKIETLTSDMDLQRSFSPFNYPQLG